MKLSQKVRKCDLSPMLRFYPLATAAQEQGKKVYRLNIGQPDIRTPMAFYDYVKQMEPSVIQYMSPPGHPALIEAVRKYYQRIGVGLKADEIQITAGGSEALAFACQCILEEGDEVLVPEPYYSNYSTFIRITGGVVRPIPTYVEENYRFAIRERIEPLINERTRAILITNPGNPTGTIMTDEEMRIMADIAKEHDLYLISDEVYREFVYGGERLATMLEFEDVAENVIIIDSISKRFSACGARIGTLISRNRAFMSEALKLCQGRVSTTMVEQEAAVALYGIDPSYFNEIRDEYRRRRDICMEELDKIPGLIYGEPKGAFYIMAKLPVDDAEELLKFMLTEFEDHGETAMFTPAEDLYETPGRGRDEVRFAYVVKEEELRRGIELLGLGIQAYNAKKQ